MKKWKFQISPFLIIVALLFIIWGQGTIFILYFLFLCLHEFVHYYFAKKLGYKMNKLKLSLFGAVLFGETDAFSDIDEIIIALSAPLFNLCVCVTIVALWWVFPTTYVHTMDICAINLVIFLFNILPFFPLDGGRALCAIISKHKTRSVAVKCCKFLTLIFGIFVFILFCFSLLSLTNFNLLIISISLVSSIMFEDKNTMFEKCVSFYSKNANRVYMLKTYFIFENVRLGKLYQKINKREYVCFNVLKKDKTIRVIYENELMVILEKYQLSEILANVIYL